jgi:hypothetical protein
MFLPLLQFKILHSMISFETISYMKAGFCAACPQIQVVSLLAPGTLLSEHTKQSLRFPFG